MENLKAENKKISFYPSPEDDVGWNDIHLKCCKVPYPCAFAEEKAHGVSIVYLRRPRAFTMAR